MSNSPISGSKYSYSSYPATTQSNPSALVNYHHPHSQLSLKKAGNRATSRALARSKSSNKPSILLDTDDNVAGGLVYGAGGGPTAWWTPIPAADTLNANSTSDSHKAETESSKDDKPSHAVELVPMSSSHRLRKVDDTGEPVWPLELEAVLIAGLRKFHATSSRPRPSATRNFNRNKLVSEYIEQVTGQKRSTKQIASRIQVLRDAWKGTKHYALVAQPKELTEMGYLPAVDDKWWEVDAPIEPLEEAGKLGPVRNTRTTRRSQKKGKAKSSSRQRRETIIGDEDVDMEDFEPPADSIPVTHPTVPSPVTAEGPITTPPWNHAHPTPNAIPFGERRVSYIQTSDLRTIVQGDGSGSTNIRHPSLSSAFVPALDNSTLTFDPYNLALLGDVIIDTDAVVPKPIQLLVKNTLRKFAGHTVLLAHAKLPPKGSSDENSTPSLLLQIDLASIRRKIGELNEPEQKRNKLGMQLLVLQNSSVYEGSRATHARVGTLVERTQSRGPNQRGVQGPSRSYVEENHHYLLSLHEKAREAFEKGQNQVTVVQSLTFLRMMDSRQLDTIAIIWIVESTGSLGSGMEFKLMRLKTEEQRIIKPQPLVKRRISTRNKPPPDITFSSPSSPLSSASSPRSPAAIPTSWPGTISQHPIAPTVVPEKAPSPIQASPVLSRESEYESPELSYSIPEPPSVREPILEVEEPYSPPNINFTPLEITFHPAMAEAAGVEANTMVQISTPEIYRSLSTESMSSIYHPTPTYPENRRGFISPSPLDRWAYPAESPSPVAQSIASFKGSASPAAETYSVSPPQEHHVQFHYPPVYHQSPRSSTSDNSTLMVPTSTHQAPCTPPVYQTTAQYGRQGQWVTIVDPQTYTSEQLVVGVPTIGVVDRQDNYMAKPSALSRVMLDADVMRPQLTVDVDHLYGWYSTGPSPVSAGVESSNSTRSYSSPRRLSEPSILSAGSSLARRGSVPVASYNTPTSTLFPLQYHPSSTQQAYQGNTTRETYGPSHSTYEGVHHGATSSSRLHDYPVQAYVQVPVTNPAVNTSCFSNVYHQ